MKPPVEFGVRPTSAGRYLEGVARVHELARARACRGPECERQAKPRSKQKTGPLPAGADTAPKWMRYHRQIDAPSQARSGRLEPEQPGRGVAQDVRAVLLRDVRVVHPRALHRREVQRPATRATTDWSVFLMKAKDETKVSTCSRVGPEHDPVGTHLLHRVPDHKSRTSSSKNIQSPTKAPQSKRLGAHSTRPGVMDAAEDVST